MLTYSQSTNYMDNDIPEEHLDWIIAPCRANSKSNPVELANWRAQLDHLAAWPADWATYNTAGEHICLVRPGSEALKKILSLAESLEDYPCLDDNEVAKIELERIQEAWDNMSTAERGALLTKNGNRVSASRAKSVDTVYRMAKETYYDLADNYANA